MIILRASLSLLVSLISFTPLFSSSYAQSETLSGMPSAVIIAYHRIGEEAYPDTNLKARQFLNHIDEIIGGEYNVMRVPDIISALKEEKPLPPHTVGITFEGAYRSAYENGMRLLLENDIPFTVFFASDYADADTKQFLGWSELQSLGKNNLVTLGILPASYERLALDELPVILGKINKARQRYRDMLGGQPSLFSYPFGEYSTAHKNIIENQGFDAAFGIHSGALHSESDFYALPRFTMTELYGDIERFRMISRAAAFPAYDIHPQAPHLSETTQSIGFTIPAALAKDKETISCFVSGQPRPDIEFLGESRVEIRLAQPIAEGRARVNCTMPGPLNQFEEKTWRWLGLLYVNQSPEQSTDIR